MSCPGQPSVFYCGLSGFLPLSSVTGCRREADLLLVTVSQASLRPVWGQLRLSEHLPFTLDAPLETSQNLAHPSRRQGSWGLTPPIEDSVLQPP